MTDDQLETLAGKAGMYIDLFRMGAASMVYSPGCHGVNLTELKRFVELLDADRAAGRALEAVPEPTKAERQSIKFLDSLNVPGWYDSRIGPAIAYYRRCAASPAASPVPAEPDLNEILSIADEESEDSTENGNRLFTREGVAKFARRMYDRGVRQSGEAEVPADMVAWSNTDMTLWRSTVEMLVDVYFDGVENAPGEGSYVSGTLGEGMRDARALLAATPQPSADMVLVPMHMTDEMEAVTRDDCWQWEDILAAAGAITEAQYDDIAAGRGAPASALATTAQPAAPTETGEAK